MTAISPILKPLLKQPDLHFYVNELVHYLQKEKLRRNEFYNWVDDDMKAEFIDGDVVIHSPVFSAHNNATKHITFIITNILRKNNIGYLGIEKVMVEFTRNSYEPDICFFKKEKAKNFKDDTKIFPIPDFIIEILSKSTEKTDRTIKFKDYERHGVEEYWIVDANNKIVEQYLLDNGIYKLKKKGNTGNIVSKVITGLNIPIKAIFDEKAFNKLK